MSAVEREGWEADDLPASLWRVVGWSRKGRPGMGDALVACAVCRRRTGVHAALDRQPAATRGNDAPLCQACDACAHVDHADVPTYVSEVPTALSEASHPDTVVCDEERYVLAVFEVSESVAGPTSVRGRYEDCPWCAMGEGSVDSCHCGMRVCGVCADQPQTVEDAQCSCGWELNADCHARDEEMWRAWASRSELE